MSEEGREFALGAPASDGSNDDNDDGANVDQGDGTDVGMSGIAMEQPNIDEIEADDIGEVDSNKSPLSTNPYSRKPDESDQESDERVRDEVMDAAVETANIATTSAATPQSPMSSLSTSTPQPHTEQIDVEDATEDSSTMAFIRSEDSGIVDHLINKGLKQEEEVRKQKDQDEATKSARQSPQQQVPNSKAVGMRKA